MVCNVPHAGLDSFRLSQPKGNENGIIDAATCG
jgi:hypothetical protein